MKAPSWWQFGLIGGLALLLATSIKLVRAVIGGFAGGADWSEAGRFAAAVFAMGFMCGIVVWAGRGLHRRLGMVGDALVGMGVMIVFFMACMLLFEPELLGAKFSSGGVPMLVFGAVLGLICGPWIGHDLRKEFSTPRTSESPDKPQVAEDELLD